MSKAFEFLFAFVLIFALESCGKDEGKIGPAPSGLRLASEVKPRVSSQKVCDEIVQVINDKSVVNKGWSTLTITHPEMVGTFNFTKMLAKFRQVKTDLDQQEIIRRIIRSFLVKAVVGVRQEQPIRPFVIPEFMCPLLSSAQIKAATFCGSLFDSNQPAAIAAALAFLDSRVAFGNYAVLDKLLTPLAFITIPPRIDLAPNEQVLEVRFVYGLRDATGAQRKQATVILEFASPNNTTFLVNYAEAQSFYKDKNTVAARISWAKFLEDSLGCFSSGICDVDQRKYNINQIRINELVFRGSDVLWDFREYRFPLLDSTVNEFAQVPLANTPWVNFDTQFSDFTILNTEFEAYLKAKGIKPTDLDADQFNDNFEAFMATQNALVSNNQILADFAINQLSALQSADPALGNKAYAFQKTSALMSPAGLARPGMKFFEGDSAWSNTFRQSCQGCHVANSSISKLENVGTTQGFYQVTPRVLPLPASAGAKTAGVNVLSPNVIKETALRYKSFASIIGCLPNQPVWSTSSVEEQPVVGHSMADQVNALRRLLK